LHPPAWRIFEMSDMESYSYVYVMINEEDNIPAMVVQTIEEARKLIDTKEYRAFFKVPYKHHN